MPALLLSMDLIFAPLVLLAGSATAELPVSRSNGPRAGARASVSARIIRGESVRFEAPDPRARSLPIGSDSNSLVLPKARDRKSANIGGETQQILIEFY
ncbi:hypothetical protein SAMN02745824_0684 [Parasphingorhabdus marina DSM 22363]|uniref:Uncharacterized protein n=1 Tax=Parasphingorhabdus marina DSM 22363 TaxID=1123272 RepID=A0A1N6CPM2_9SPHN|nr:hypothetical protein [Parasphingorhabdus marina]SIN60518.1 hypothetical protein SAMN02745824_0684 [Parasphingorhabdus marina DSM 22363]